MSDNYLLLIPTDPQFVPSPASVELARQRLEQLVPDADEVTAVVNHSVEFIDQGSNFERVRERSTLRFDRARRSTSESRPTPLSARARQPPFSARWGRRCSSTSRRTRCSIAGSNRSCSRCWRKKGSAASRSPLWPRDSSQTDTWGAFPPLASEPSGLDVGRHAD